MKLTKFISFFETFFPKRFAESWDKIGLLVNENEDKKIEKIIVVNDLTMDLVEEAKKEAVDLIMCYHPLIFSPLKTVSISGTWQEKVVIECLKNNISVYSMHTVLDNTRGAMVDYITKIFKTHNLTSRPILNLPESGYIHSYKFKANSLISVFRNILQIQEVFLEVDDSQTNCFAWFKTEPNLDIFNKVSFNAMPKNDLSIVSGSGRLVTFVKPIKLEEIVDAIKKFTGNQSISVATNSPLSKEVFTLGIVPGSGASVLKNCKCDVLITGEMLHHDILAAVEEGKHVILTGHTAIENPFLRILPEIITRNLKLAGLEEVSIKCVIPTNSLIKLI